jgi:L-ascorbate metabolism protein UlaG (beta-lactamase superfamily)
MARRTWRNIADWAKHKPLALRAADWLGRGRGRFRVLDRIAKPQAAKKPDLSRWNGHELAAVWIGHATILLRVGGLTILTDPVLSNRIGVGLGIMTGGPRRFIGPALKLRELPALDLILVSHAHFDHLDRPTLARLPRDVPVVTARDTSDLIRDLGFANVTEMGWGEKLGISSMQLTAQKVVHWGARTFYDHHRGFNAYLIEAGNRRVLYGGDTAYHDHFRGVGKVDLAILGIGAYNPFIKAHASPDQAWEMVDHLRADWMLPMHHSTFRLSHEPMDEPMERLFAAAGKGADRIVARTPGDQWQV